MVVDGLARPTDFGATPLNAPFPFRIRTVTQVYFEKIPIDYSGDYGSLNAQARLKTMFLPNHR